MEVTHNTDELVWLKFQKITVWQLEENLKKRLNFSRQKWADHIAETPIFFDFSRVTWVEIRAIAMIASYIEAALRSDAQVVVSLPHTDKLLSDDMKRASTRTTVTQAERRAEASRFLSYLRFFPEIIDASKRISTGKLEIISGIDSGRFEKTIRYKRTINSAHIFATSQCISEERLAALGASQGYTYTNIFPLKRMSFSDLNEEKLLTRFFTDVLSRFKRQGMMALDVQDLTNVILGEFLENVEMHAHTTTYAYIAAHVRPTHTFEKSYSPENSYFEWRSDNRSASREKDQDYSIEIVVADSGVGIAQTLKGNFKAQQPDVPSSDNAVLTYAFDRWSTAGDASLKRGTRGLYRLSRIAQKYDGLISLRSGQGYAGRDLAGANVNQELGDKSVRSFFPGTICYFHSSTNNLKPGIWRKRLSEVETSPFRAIRIGEICEGGLTKVQTQRLEDAIAAPENRTHAIAISIDGEVKKSATLLNFLVQLSEVRHPQVMILAGLSGGKELAESAVNSANAELDRLQEIPSVVRNIYDPVMVVGETPNDFYWIAQGATKRKVLKKLVHSENYEISRSSLEEMIDDHTTSIDEFLRELSEDRHLFSVTKNSGVTLRFSPSHLAAAIESNFHDEIQNAPEFRSPKPIVTPSLAVTDHWFSSEILGASEASNPLLLFHALVAKIQTSAKVVKNVGEELVLFHDKSLRDQEVEILSKALGTARRLRASNKSSLATNYQSGIQNRTAVVFTSILRSGKTARSLAKKAILSGLEPSCICTLVDGRPNCTSSIDVWGRAIPVYSLSNTTPLSDEVLFLPEDELEFICPTSRKFEKVQECGKKSSTLSSRDFLHILAESSAYEFGHVERESGRHFLGYMFPGNLSQSDTLINALEKAILIQISGFKKDSLKQEDWVFCEKNHPTTSHKFTITRLLDKIQFLKCIPRVRVFKNRGKMEWQFSELNQSEAVVLTAKNVFIFDWGSLSGNSIRDLIQDAVERGAKRVVVLSLISQLDQSEQSWLESLKSVQRSRTDNDDHTPTDDYEVECRIQFLTRFPTKVYDADDCPLCLRSKKVSADVRTAGSHYLMDGELRRNDRFSIVRRQNLKSDPRYPIVEQADLFAVLSLRSKFQDAEKSTYARWRLWHVLRETSEEQNAHSLSTGNTRALIYLLTSEPNWTRADFAKSGGIQRLLCDVLTAFISKNDVSSDQRADAIQSLREISKKRFIEGFSKNFSAVMLCDASDSLFFHMTTIFQRDFHTITQRFKEICEITLSKCRSDLVARASELQDFSRDRLGRNLDHLERTVNNALSASEAASSSRLDAWMKLKLVLGADYRNHHNQNSASNGYSLLDLSRREVRYREDLALLEQGRLEDFHRSAGQFCSDLYTNWEKFSAFLESKVLPNLAAFEDDLQSREGSRIFGGAAEAGYVFDLVSQYRQEKSILKHKLLLAAQKLSQNDDLSADHWKLYRDEFKMMDRLILFPGTQVSAKTVTDFEKKPSLLIQALEECPCIMQDELSACIEKFRSLTVGDHHFKALTISANGIPSEPIAVFCSKIAFEEVFLELLKNTRNEKSDSVDITIDIENDSGSESIIVWIRNSYPRVEADGTRVGLGLQRSKEMLGFYDAELIIPAPIRSPLEYKIGVKLVRI